MAILVQTMHNDESNLEEVVSFQVIPRVKRPSVLDDGYHFFDQVDPTFYIDWYRYHVVDDVLVYNPDRVSIETGHGV